MRSVSLMVVAVLLAVAGPAYAQSQCDGYPASKSWRGDTATGMLQTPAAPFLGWSQDNGGLFEFPVMVDGERAQRDSDTDSKVSYDSGTWTIASSFETPQKLSVTWRIHVSSAGNKMPALKIYDGKYRLRLDFDPTLSNDDCPLPGWKQSGDTNITAGGRLLGADRYLLMPMNEWHTIRADLHADGTFDAWLDGGGSDWKHISGYCDERTSAESPTLKIGASESFSGTTEYSTSCLAWGEGGEIPTAPAGPDEICTNFVDDDGDELVDCDDPDCDCITVPPQCGETTDIFERFNVNFSDDPVVAGRVPPNWYRDKYDNPAYSDEDPTIPPGASLWNIAPDSPNPGPYYWPDPGPYEEERDAMYDACMAGEIDWDDYPEFASQRGACSPADAQCCGDFAGWLFHTTQPLRMILVLDKIPCDPPCGCGSTDPACMAGLITLEREVVVDDLAFLPIDWNQPVKISAEAIGIDKITEDGSGGKWETFLTYIAPGGTPPPVSETRIEWGADGDLPNGDEVDNTNDYETIDVVLDPGQGSVLGTLVLGVDFDYIGATLPGSDTSTAFFENVRITYSADLTKPLIHLDKMAINHTILRGEDLSDDTFTITNAQPVPGTTLTYTIDDDASATWLTTVGGDGTSTGESDLVTIDYVDTAGLATGIYVGVITVDSAQINKSPATITVTVEVIGEEIGLSETEFVHLQVPQGTSLPNDSFDVANVGGGAMNYTITDDAAWLSTVPTAGGPLGASEGDTIDVVYDVASLPVDTYYATIEVASTEADNTPQSIAVTVEIVLNPPDYDSDGDVDQDDFAVFQGCITGDGGTAAPGLCGAYADLSCDNDVDQEDLSYFEACASGPDVPFDPGCYTPPPACSGG